MTVLFRYAAFISYSSGDAHFSRRLHRALERYRIPAALGKFDLLNGGGRINRIYPIYRDREEAAAGGLGEQIEAALRASGALIVVCSPNAAKSSWVEKEIEFYARFNRIDRIFPIVCDTAPTLDQDGADATPLSFPRALTNSGMPQKIAADARKGKDGFHNALLKIIAGLVDRTPGEIIDRDQQMQRRRHVATAIASLAVVIGGWVIVAQQRERARSESVILSSVSNQLHAQSDFVGGMRVGILAVADSFLSPAAPEALNALLSNAADSLLELEVGGGELEQDACCSGGALLTRDESRILTWRDTARLWNARTGVQIGPPLRHDGPAAGAYAARASRPVIGAVFSQDESSILTWGADGTARLWNAAAGAQIGPSLHHGPSLVSPINGARVEGAMFSKDESRILTWGDDGTARLWNARTGAQIGPPLEHGGRPVTGAMFSRDESHIITWTPSFGLGQGVVRLWNVATGAQIGSPLRHDSSVQGVVLSRDGSRILTWGSDGTARLWNAATGVQIGPSLKHEASTEGVLGAVFSKDERRILTWSDDGTARLWNAANARQIGLPLRHNGRVKGAAFSRDESRILTWGYDGTARLWNTATNTQIGSPLKHDVIVDGAIFSKNESRVLTWSGGIAWLWDIALGFREPIPERLVHGTISRAAFSKDERKIFTVDFHGAARLWTTPNWPLQHFAVEGVVLSSDEKRMLTFGGVSAQLWNTATGVKIGPALEQGLIHGALFSHDEKWILTWGEDGTAKLWNADTGALIGVPLTHQGRVHGAVLSHKDDRILTWSDNILQIWNAANGTRVGPSLRHDGPVRGGMFSQDDGRILSWSDDRTARLWSAETGLQTGPSLIHEGSVNGAMLSPDQSRIFTWTEDGTVRVSHATGGAQISPVSKHNGPVNGAAFSADWTRFLTWSRDGTVRLWNASDGRQIGAALRHTNSEFYPVNGAAFYQDDTRILTWNGDATLRLWNAATGKQVDVLLLQEHSPHIPHGLLGAVLSKDKSLVLSWDADGYVGLWDVLTGARLGPSLHRVNLNKGALFFENDSRVLTWTRGGTVEQFDVEWAVQRKSRAGLLRGICSGKMKGTTVTRINEGDIQAAPFLRGRLGEDMCASHGFLDLLP